MVTWRSGGQARRGLCCVLVGGAALAFPACRARNPAFGDGETEASAASADGGRTSVADASTTDATRGDSKGTDSGPDTSTSVDATTHSNTEADPVSDSSDASGPVETCEPYAGPLVNGVTVDNATIPCPGVVVHPNALLVMRGEVLEVTACEGCPANCGGSLVTIDLDVSVKLPSLPQCGAVAVWGSPDQPDPCEWRGVSIFDSEEKPLFVVSDGRVVPPGAGGMEATLDEAILCDGQCAGPWQPGVYSLSMGAEPVASGDLGEALVAVGEDSVAAQFENRSAVVGVDCEPEVSWILDFTAAKGAAVPSESAQPSGGG